MRNAGLHDVCLYFGSGSLSDGCDVHVGFLVNCTDKDNLAGEQPLELRNGVVSDNGELYVVEGYDSFAWLQRGRF